VKILSVVGARPNFMKVAPIIHAIREYNKCVTADGLEEHEHSRKAIQHVLVHTGQHYDELMSGRFFSDLNLPKPDVHLGVGSGSHAKQTAEIIRSFEDVLLAEKPHIVLVVGDVNSTLACALVTSKIACDISDPNPQLAHVEAGLRSFDRMMPEEINRVVTDHVSDILFVTERSGLRNLQCEGIPHSKVHFVGNTMIDTLLSCTEKAEASTVLDELGLRRNIGEVGRGDVNRRYALLTLHRPSNVDSRDAFLNILSGLEELAQDCPIVFPMHPRTRRRLTEFGLESRLEDKLSNIRLTVFRTSAYTEKGIIVTDSLGYLDFLCLMKHATLVVTDSGGIQEETTCLGIPCVTIRENTERPVTIESGTNVLAGTTQDGIKRAIRQQTARKFSNRLPDLWDGQAARRILDVLVHVGHNRTSSELSFTAQTFA
jgi:UDP-N-acetylglucosamine 2-epimerase (non-hydrolysing)